MSKKRKQDNNYINSAIQEGINSLVKAHPRFSGFQEYLAKHIDTNKIGEKTQQLYNEAESMGYNGDRARQFIAKGIREYIASGEMLDERGKAVILKNSLEEKTGFLQRIFKGKNNQGEKYLDNTMGAFQDLYSMFNSGNYAERMPELQESISTLYDLQFLDPAIDVLKSYGLMDTKKHKALKEQVYRRANEQSENLVSGIEKRVMYSPQQVAASIIGFLGICLIIFNLKITGAVIGTSNFSISGIIGLFILFLSLIFFLKSSKKKIRKLKN